jgi:hypothetical protein
MKRITWLLTVLTLLVGCSGFAAAQCTSGTGGYDLLQTSSGTQDNLSSVGLGTVTFQGVPLPSSAQAGTADTIVWREGPVPPSGGCINIQVIALYLQSVGAVTCNNAACSPGEQVTVYATINQTNGVISTTQLPQPDSLPGNTGGTMTVYTNPDTFNTTSLAIQADLIVVPYGDSVTTTPIFHTPMPTATVTSSGSSWTPTAPSGYPDSTPFPAGGFYVNSYGSGGAVLAALASRSVRGSLYGLGLLFVGIAVLKIRSGVTSGRLNLRPVYLLGLAAIAWFVAWRSSSFAYPMIAQAKATCVAQTHSASPTSETGLILSHLVKTAACSPTTASASVGP